MTSNTKILHLYSDRKFYEFIILTFNIDGLTNTYLNLSDNYPNIIIRSNIHISSYSAIYGAKGVEMEEFTGLSPRCTIFSSTDDFSGNFLISPTVPKEFTNVTSGKVLIKKYSQIGAGSIIMPNITINEGVAVGAMSFVNSNLEEWYIYAGVPVKK
ncbi:MAG: acyltransferase [Sedimentibacter sp.]|nr:acyltransferase [Sedimentibacter sp.]